MLYFSMFFAGDFDLGFGSEFTRYSDEFLLVLCDFLKFQCVLHVKAGAGLVCGERCHSSLELFVGVYPFCFGITMISYYILLQII